MAKKILVIDDSALMRRVISDIINESDEYEVVAIAKDGLEGLDMIVSHPWVKSAPSIPHTGQSVLTAPSVQRVIQEHCSCAPPSGF